MPLRTKWTSAPGAPRDMMEASAAQPGNALALGSLILLVLLFGILKGASIPLWADELATVHIAAAPTWAGMLDRGHFADLNPPLLTALVRTSFYFFGPHELGARMPSVIAFAAATAALFFFLRRRMSLAFATLGALLLVANLETRYYMTEARPYALLMAAVFVGLLAYDSIVLQRHLALARITLGVAILVMLQAHLFGTVAAGGFFLAEAVRSFRLRRIDPLTVAAILLPWLSCLDYGPILRGQTSGSTLVYSEHDRVSLRRGLSFYGIFCYTPLTGLLKAAALILLCVPFFPKLRFSSEMRLPAELWALFVVLFATPLLLTFVLRLHSAGSAFYPRYAIAAVVPLCVLLPAILAWRGGNFAIAGWLLVGAALLVFVRGLRDEDWHLRNFKQDGLLGTPSSYTSTGQVSAICPSLPLVMNDPLDFMEADYRLGPAKERRLVYVTDAAESLRLEHANAGESISSMDKVFHLDHRVIPSAQFAAEHQELLVLSRPGKHDWFLDAAQEKKARIEPIGMYRFTGKKDQLWFVSMNPTAPTPSCLASIAGK